MSLLTNPSFSLIILLASSTWPPRKIFSFGLVGGLRSSAFIVGYMQPMHWDVIQNADVSTNVRELLKKNK